ncbi:uncharacterized protein, partial [Triticum aestivum]|uniref:uncharacterized protein n=1 Tax=Triticum aestivum TaxID=4565 RepID=UPI001D03232C
ALSLATTPDPTRNPPTNCPRLRRACRSRLLPAHRRPSLLRARGRRREAAAAPTSSWPAGDPASSCRGGRLLQARRAPASFRREAAASSRHAGAPASFRLKGTSATRLNFTLHPRRRAAPAPPPLAARSVSPSSPARRPVRRWTWLLDGVKPASEHRQLHCTLQKKEQPQVHNQKNEEFKKNKDGLPVDVSFSTRLEASIF